MLGLLGLRVENVVGNEADDGDRETGGGSDERFSDTPRDITGGGGDIARHVTEGPHHARDRSKETEEGGGGDDEWSRGTKGTPTRGVNQMFRLLKLVKGKVQQKPAERQTNRFTRAKVNFFTSKNEFIGSEFWKIFFERYVVLGREVSYT